MTNILTEAEQALRDAARDYHRLPTHGKISVHPTKPLSNQRDLSLAYSPGVAYPCLDIHADPKAADGVVREAGLKHKRARRWAQAVECLRRLVNTESFDDETRYALSVCNLKSSAKEIAASARAEDYALRGFQPLARNKAFKLFEQLKKETALDAADLYYVGFHFSETTGEEKEFGEALLRHVVRRWPRSETGRAAKGKLKLAGSA